ncbi:MAG: nucleotidyl transferase AbiEii/AbiGii toxin family protein [Lentisphaerota bacterium]
MKIDKVISETIFAIYRTPEVSQQLFLKGGSAMRLFDHLMSRLSIDADFSMTDRIDHEQRFFSAIKTSVGSAFRRIKLDVIDFKWEQRPRNQGRERPAWWRGWVCQFKLVAFGHRGSSIEVKRRNALIPEGANSSVITIEISEHEYCGRKKDKDRSGSQDLGLFTGVAGP